MVSLEIKNKKSPVRENVDRERRKNEEAVVQPENIIDLWGSVLRPCGV